MGNSDSSDSSDSDLIVRSKSPDINELRRIQERELLAAIRDGNYEEVRKLLDSFNRSFYDCFFNRRVYEMISTAVKHKHSSIAKLILEKFPSDLEFANRKKLLADVIDNGDVETLKILLEKGSDKKANYVRYIMKQESGSSQFSALHAAAQSGHLDVVKLILSNGAFINAKNSTHRIPLHMAASRGHPKVVKYFIQNGGALNAKDINGLTPLHCAAKSKSIECVKVLLENGADGMNLDHFGQTFLHNAAKGSPDVLEYIINLGIFDINIKSNRGNTPFHLAVQHSIATTEILLRFGADVSNRNNNGETPLHLAISHGYENIIKRILSRGVDMECQNNNGRSIAHEIFSKNYGQFLPLFLNHGFNINSLLSVEATTVENWLGYSNSILLKQLALAVAKNQYVDGKFFEMITKSEKLNKRYEACGKELKAMKTEMIENTNFSIFDVCTRDLDELVGFLRNHKVSKAMNNYDFKAKFPIYVHEIRNQLRMGKERKPLLEKCKDNCYFAFSKLPIACFDKMLSFLMKEDLQRLIDACKPVNVK